MEEIKKNDNVSIKETQIEEKIDKNYNVTQETKRIKSIDRFRGFCVFAMLIFQFLKNFKNF